jgi:hypothetical protein
VVIEWDVNREEWESRIKTEGCFVSWLCRSKSSSD